MKVHVVQLYCSTDTLTTWKNSRFILSERLNFYVVDSQLIAVHALTYAYIDITFWWDIANEVCVVVY